MTKQRRKPRNRPIGNMSFLERAGLIFGVIGLFADFTVLFTFATGVASINQYLPKSIPTSSSLLFFALTTALFIIYGWFAVSWYLIRRSFVLLGQMPIRFNYPLVGRSLRTVAGIGFVLIPLMIAWSVVNLPSDYIKGVGLFTPSGRFVTVTPAPTSLTQTLISTTAPTAIETPQRIVVPISEQEQISSGWGQYFTFCFPFFLLLFAFVIWLPINLLMPIVHVELLLQEASPDIMDELREYFEQDN